MATQKRISTTKAILDFMKNIMMMGLTNNMEAKIEAAREFEIKMYIGLNRLFVAFNASGELPTPSVRAWLLLLYES
jgi:ATP-binding cassette subfamily C (CFTR/MRP) protein 1